MRLQSAIFDLDGTLVDSLEGWAVVTRDLIRRRGGVPPSMEEMQRRMLPLSIPEMAQWFHEEYLPDCSAGVLEKAINDDVEDYYTNHVALKPGVKDFLFLLKLEGVDMYVATATRRPLVQAALKHTGISQFFKGIITSDEVGISKEKSPAIYERAMTRLQSNKLNTVVFEDALFAVRTAKKAGFRVAVVYDRCNEAVQEELKSLGDYYITSFTELYQRQQTEQK